MHKNLMLLLIILVLFSVGIGLSACNTVVTEEVVEIVCNDPYIQVGSECCLDQNDNDICDFDEEEVEEVVEELEEEVVPVVASCDDAEFTIVNICTLTDAIVYTIDIGAVDIDSFDIEIIHNDPTQNSTSRGSPRSASTSMTVTGATANERLRGQLRLPPYVFSEAIITSTPCGIVESSGPGFPGVMQSC